MGMKFRKTYKTNNCPCVDCTSEKLFKCLKNCCGYEGFAASWRKLGNLLGLSEQVLNEFAVTITTPTHNETESKQAKTRKARILKTRSTWKARKSQALRLVVTTWRWRRNQTETRRDRANLKTFIECVEQTGFPLVASNFD